MNVLFLRHSNIMSNVATLINLIVILKRRQINFYFQ